MWGTFGVLGSLFGILQGLSLGILRVGFRCRRCGWSRGSDSNHACRNRASSSEQWELRGRVPPIVAGGPSPDFVHAPPCRSESQAPGLRGPVSPVVGHHDSGFHQGGRCHPDQEAGGHEVKTKPRARRLKPGRQAESSSPSSLSEETKRGAVERVEGLGLRAWGNMDLLRVHDAVQTSCTNYFKDVVTSPSAPKTITFDLATPKGFRAYGS